MSTKGTARMAVCGTGALMLALGIPAVARGQHSLDTVQVVTRSDAQAQADGIHERAVGLQSTMSTFREAARLHAISAALRAPDDPRSATCLRTAALLTYYAGRRAAADDLMEQAAQRAAARGDVVTAATAYVDAGVIAEELGKPARADALGRKGEDLMNSPLLTDVQRATLRARVTHVREVAALDLP